MRTRLNSLKYSLFLLIIFLLFTCNQKDSPQYLTKINSGQFAEAKIQIQNILQNDRALSDEERQKLLWEIERMRRIEKDFNQPESAVLEYVSKYIPDIDSSDLKRWEEQKYLEFMIIDGDKRYFRYAARNLFRLDPQCKDIWSEYYKDRTDTDRFNLDKHIEDVIKIAVQQNKKFVKPVKIRVQYQISVDENIVPRGELIRCWIPFPREIPGRQEEINILRSDPPSYQVAGNEDCVQRTIYLERPSAGPDQTEFSVNYEFTSYGSYVPIVPDSVIPAIPSAELVPYLVEEYPHIVFTPELKEISHKIVGNEKNPYLIARRLFEWIDLNIPWASAREYSTIRNISQYAIQNMHGDCGIKALLFITLLRLNGIPARWQSGWEFQPPDHNMHDWGMVYFEPYGWMAMDVDYGLRQSENEQLKWFYLTGMDSYRLIYNDAFSQKLCPPKTHFRSETIDSQRGELEWKGGNLYFDQWSWDMKFEIVQN
ncbi:MAG: transglutaminase domain-containing protein [bacterium]|nr:MAG: transglutaminase domain-containing protein [bacterium]